VAKSYLEGFASRGRTTPLFGHPIQNLRAGHRGKRKATAALRAIQFDLQDRLC